jgi:bacteriocin biosynthesis cyclodehydratase domain-containing protein
VLLEQLHHRPLLPPLLVTKPAAPSSAVPEHPSLAPWYRLVQEEGRLLLEHGGSVVTLEGRAAGLLLPVLIPLLDGTRTVEQVVDELGSAAAPSVEKALALLARHGLLCEGPSLEDSPDHGSTHAAAFSAAISGGRSPAAIRTVLGQARVAVAGRSSAAEEIVRLLSDAGVGDVFPTPLEHDEGAALLVCAPAPKEVRSLESFNERRLADGTPWLQLLPPDGRAAVVGPLYLPGESACFACYRLRRAACSEYEEDYDAIDAVPSRAAIPRALSAVTAGIAVAVALRWLGTHDPTLPGRFYAFETGVVLGLSHHTVLRVPRCPACGPRDNGGPPSPWFKAPGP